MEKTATTKKPAAAKKSPAAPRKAAAPKAGKIVVQQGDDVILHTRSPIMGQTEVLASVIKVNQDATIAVRVPNNGYGRHEDFTGVKTAPQADGSFWASWPERNENLDEAAEAEAETAADPAPALAPAPASAPTE